MDKAVLLINTTKELLSHIISTGRAVSVAHSRTFTATFTWSLKADEYPQYIEEITNIWDTYKPSLNMSFGKEIYNKTLLNMSPHRTSLDVYINDHVRIIFSGTKTQGYLLTLSTYMGEQFCKGVRSVNFINNNELSISDDNKIIDVNIGDGKVLYRCYL